MPSLRLSTPFLLALAIATPAFGQSRFAAHGPHHVESLAARSLRALVVDADGDGREDVLVIDAEGRHALHLGNGDGTLRAAPSGWSRTEVGTCVNAAAHDLDGDGNDDVLIARGLGFEDRVWFGTGTGTFVDGPTLGGSEFWTTLAFAMADVDRDGDTDVIAARLGREPVLYRNEAGRLLLDPSFSFAGLPNAHGVGLRDLDGDGLEELVLLHASGFDVLSGSSLAPPSSFSATRMANALDLEFLDRDGDGDLDLALIHGEGVEIHENRGSLRFVPSVALSFPLPGRAIVAGSLADVDADGRPDLLLACREANRVLFLRPFGFEERLVELPDVRHPTRDLVALDADLDGDLDLFAANSGRRDDLALNDGTGRFVSTGPMEPGMFARARVIRAADMDGDRDLDLVASCGEGVELHWNLGDGRFRRHVDVEFEKWQNVRDLQVEDWDGDGRAEILLARRDLSGGPLESGLLTPDVRWNFSNVAATRLRSGPVACEAVAKADVNGDGRNDLVFASWGSPPSVRLADGSGSFRNLPGAFPAAHALAGSALALGDFDEDRDLDVLIGDALDHDALFRNRGDGTFERVDSPTLALFRTETTAVVTDDFDGDGHLDLVLGAADGFVRLLLGRGNGTFVDVTHEQLPGSAGGPVHAVAAGDLDQDGDVDLLLVVGRRSRSERFWRNVGAGYFADATAAFLPEDRHESRAVALADLDGDADLDYACGALVLRYSNHRQLDVDRLARPGEPLTWTLTAFAARTMDRPFVYLHLGTERLPFPRPTIFGHLRIDPAEVTWVRKETLAPGGGSVRMGGVLPLDPRLVGGVIYAQGFAIHRLALEESHFTGMLRVRVAPR